MRTTMQESAREAERIFSRRLTLVSLHRLMKPSRSDDGIKEMELMERRASKATELRLRFLLLTPLTVALTLTAGLGSGRWFAPAVDMEVTVMPCTRESLPTDCLREQQ